MTAFLTVKEASQRTGKSPSSIRRVIYPITHNDAHADRAHVLPTVEEARALRIKGENFAWRLSEDLLRREIPTDNKHETAAEVGVGKASSRAESELLAMLRRELDIKNQQIVQQGDLIGKQIELVNGLSERLREGNHLIASLQQRLALTDGRSTTVVGAAAPGAVNSTSSKKGSSMRPHQAKRSLFSRLFH